MVEAYIYTGDAKYGRLGAILVDRVADVYDEMYIRPYFPNFFNSDGTRPKGKSVGSIWEHITARYMALGYDAFYDMYEDPQVLKFISDKAKTYELGSSKNTPEIIRNRIEDKLLREIRDSILTGNIHGNFGMHQSCMAYTAVVLDSMPETQEMIDWVFKSGLDGFFDDDRILGGGNVMSTLVNTVTREGAGAEAGPNYNDIWIGAINGVMDALAGYEKYSAWDLYNHPKGRKMLTWAYPLTLTRNQTAQIGDSSAVALPTLYLRLTTDAFQYSGDIKIAQMLYAKNGNSTKGLHYNKYHPNPNQIQQDIKRIIDEYGTYDFDKSEQITTYGFSILRSGSLYEAASEVKDTQRDFWIYYGKNGGHGHPDTLNLGIEAYGLNMAPDLGYPEAADGSYKNIYWGQATINHNTVMVNQQRMQSNYAAGESGDALHFDGSSRVKLMDVDAPAGYPATSIFRRTVVMVDVNDEVSYGVDFFRVKGGKRPYLQLPFAFR